MPVTSLNAFRATEASDWIPRTSESRTVGGLEDEDGIRDRAFDAPVFEFAFDHVLEHCTYFELVFSKATDYLRSLMY